MRPLPRRHLDASPLQRGEGPAVLGGSVAVVVAATVVIAVAPATHILHHATLYTGMDAAESDGNVTGPDETQG